MKLRTLMLAMALSGAISPIPLVHAQQQDSVRNLLQAARLWEGKERPDIAREFLQKALLIQPDSPEIIAMLGNLAARGGKPEEAMRYQRQLERFAPSSPLLTEMRDTLRVNTTEKATLARMRLMARAGQIEEAEKLLLRLYPAKPPHGDLAVEYYSIVGSTPKGYARAREGLQALYRETGDERYRLALFNLMAGNSTMRPSAIKGFEELSRSSSVNARKLQEAWRNSLYKLPDNTGTVGAIRRYLAVYPDDRSMMDQIATVQKNARERARDGGGSVDDDKHSSDPFVVARAYALEALDKGDFDLAEKKLQLLLKQRPGDGEVIGGLGMIRFKRGQHQEAADLFAQANRATPGGSRKWRSMVTTAHFWEHMRTGDKLLEAGQLAQAEHEANAALALQPGDADALVLLANIRFASKDVDAAEKLYRQALSREPDNGAAMRGLVSLLSRSERRPEAFSLLQSYAQRYPKDQDKYASVQADMLRDQADLDIAAGRPSRAVQALEAAILLQPSDAWNRYALAKLYDSLKLAPLARQVMNDGVHAAPKDASMRYARSLLLISEGEYQLALKDLAAIPDAEKTSSMKNAAVRATLNLYISQAKDALQNNEPEQAARIMVMAEDLALRQEGLAASEQVAEGWFSMNQPERGLALMRQRLDEKSPTDDRIYYASLLNRAKQDQELSALLPALNDAVQNEPVDRMTEDYARLHEIRDALQNRELQRLVDDGNLRLARKRVGGSTTPTSDDQAAHSLARRWLLVRQPDKALPLLQALKQRKPADVDIRTDLIDAYYDAHRRSAARAEASELLTMTRRDDLQARLDIARTLIHIDDYQTAGKVLDDLAQRFPDNADVVFLMGRVAAGERNYNRAIRLFQLSETLSMAQPAPSEDATGKQVLLDLLPLDEGDPRWQASTRERETALPSDLGAIDSSRLAHFSSTGNDGLDRARAQIADVENRRQPRLEIGLDTLSKSSSDGTSTYEGRETPVVAWMPIGYNGHGFLHLDRVTIDAGRLPTNFRELSEFGSFAAYQGSLSEAQMQQLAHENPQQVSGTSVGVGYESDLLRADIGVIGLGFPVSNLVGGIRRSGTAGAFDYSVNLSRRPQTSSLLSYAGTRDPVTGEVWGGVTDTSASARLSTSIGEYNLTGALAYGILNGKNVLGNNYISMRAGVDKDVYRSHDTILNTGLTLSYAAYAENESFYTFGHGGYYSPQKNLGLSVPLQINGRAQRLSYMARASVSYTQTSEKDMAVYPNNSALQDKAEAGPRFPAFLDDATYTGGNGGGLGYAFRAVAEYRVTPHVIVGGRINIDRSDNYSPSSVLVYLRYTFKPQIGEVSLWPDAVQPYSQF